MLKLPSKINNNELKSELQKNSKNSTNKINDKHLNQDKEKPMISPFNFNDKKLNNDCYNDEYSLKELLIEQIFILNLQLKIMKYQIILLKK